MSYTYNKRFNSTVQVFVDTIIVQSFQQHTSSLSRLSLQHSALVWFSWVSRSKICARWARSCHHHVTNALV